MDYLGNNAPIGTMPAAVPASPGSAVSPLLDAIRPALPAQPGVGLPPFGGDPNDPASHQYSAVTQQDGSIVLYLKNPDGSIGPAVKIINPIKPKKA